MKAKLYCETFGYIGGATGAAWREVLAGEGQTAEERVAREGGQNSGNAHDKNKPPVHIRLRRFSLTGPQRRAYADFLSVKELAKRSPLLKLQPGNALEALRDRTGAVEALTIEDFNTVGLGGALPSPDHAPASEDHFIKLLFMLGGTSKTGEAGTGGSFGYGKAVYSSISNARAAIYYSRFQPTTRTNGTSRRLIGCGLLDEHEFEGKLYTGRTYFGDLRPDGYPIPFVDDEADALARVRTHNQ